MNSEVNERSAHAAAQGVRAGTFAIWQQRESAAQRAASRYVAEGGGSAEAQWEAAWSAHVEAFRSRTPVIWRVCEAPGQHRRSHWVLEPAVLEDEATEAEAAAATARGDLVVMPGDDVEPIMSKMEVARTIRAHLANVA